MTAASGTEGWKRVTGGASWDSHPIGRLAEMGGGERDGPVPDGDARLGHLIANSRTRALIVPWTGSNCKTR